jgi:hypothetical protein
VTIDTLPADGPLLGRSNLRTQRGRRNAQHVGAEVPQELGVTAQREIELAVREQLDTGALRGDETLEATATVTVRGLSHDVVVTGTIELA